MADTQAQGQGGNSVESELLLEVKMVSRQVADLQRDYQDLAKLVHEMYTKFVGDLNTAGYFKDTDRRLTALEEWKCQMDAITSRWGQLKLILITAALTQVVSLFILWMAFRTGLPLPK